MGSRKQPQPFVVGKWEGDVFTAHPEQPDGPITNLNDMVTWCKANLKEDPGVYDLIRKTPGHMVLAIQQTFKFSYEQD